MRNHFGNPKKVGDNPCQLDGNPADCQNSDGGFRNGL